MTSLKRKRKTTIESNQNVQSGGNDKTVNTTSVRGASTSESDTLSAHRISDIHTSHPQLSDHQYVGLVRHNMWRVAVEQLNGYHSADVSCNNSNDSTQPNASKLPDIHGNYYTCFAWFHLPLRLTPQYWIRHRMTRENVLHLLKKYTHPRVIWQLVLCEGLNIPNSAVKISNASQTSFTMFGKSTAIDMILNKYASIWNQEEKHLHAEGTSPTDVCMWPVLYQSLHASSSSSMMTSFAPRSNSSIGGSNRAPPSSSSSTSLRMKKSSQTVNAPYITSVEMDNTRYPMPIHRVTWNEFHPLWKAVRLNHVRTAAGSTLESKDSGDQKPYGVWLGQSVRHYEHVWKWRGIFVVPYRCKDLTVPVLHMIRVLPWKWYIYWKGRPQSLTHCPDVVHVKPSEEKQPRRDVLCGSRQHISGADPMDDYWVTLDEQFMMALEESEFYQHQKCIRDSV